MKKASILLLILTLVLTMGLTGVYAEEPIKVSVDGTILNFDVNPTVIEGRTLVPLRAIFEALGAEIEWENTTKTVTATKEDIKITLEIGSKYATVNGEEKELEVEGKIIDDRAMVPARFIAESLGASVEWNAEEKTVVIASAATTESATEPVDKASAPGEEVTEATDEASAPGEEVTEAADEDSTPSEDVTETADEDSAPSEEVAEDSAN
ncbi:copper amine oxidase N-terminal domain-containing protein [Geosporobacter ferrireducens]|uniref:copper amine oxidase N-terminal domain-containing protein n=1 Tax=Geosporobacter ferrireducens TaxID=1424294 RepID=UPI00139C7400|nr:copper amine oxidase N-terminal domain-containing protein [Geosporobacter ferrireducens]MTI54741.1 copper amine oxidase N-terminal domain-containing protein [Geosporobacter ferrireducens]